MVPFVIVIKEGARPMPDETQLDRIERKLDTLIRALAEEEEQAEPAHTLDGEPAGQERDQGESLG